jgi:DNA-binding CsgD family transcriptional regulator
VEPEERGRHLALAADEPDAETAAAIEAGALAAFRRGAPAAAAELAEDAVRLTRPADEAHRRRRALSAADYRFEAGDTDGACRLLDDLIAEAPPGPERAALLGRLARFHHFRDDVGGGVAVLRQALAEAGDVAPLRAEIEEGLAWGLLLMRSDLPAAAEHGRSAARFAERAGDQAALAEALAAQALTEFVLGRDSTATMERALALEPATLHLRVLRHPSFAYGYRLSCADELDRARTVFQELAARAAEQGDESALAPIHNHLALVECLAANWDAAASHADEGYAIALQVGQRPSQASILAKAALIHARRGTVDAARATAAQSLGLAAPGFDASIPEPALARGGETAIWTLGFLELSLGDALAADRYLRPLAERLLAAGLREPGELRPLPDAIEALVALGRLEDAESLLAELDVCAQLTGRRSALAAAARCRGLLLAAGGDVDAAVVELERSVEHPLPFERARALLDLGRVQRRAKRRGAARTTLAEAHEAFERLGAAIFVASVDDELRRIGGRAPSAGELTPSERRIAELVAEGRSNKDVATALFVTPKTVETQLGRIYGKLGIHSRAELARLVGDRKL